jgi:hypothetical protein
VRVEPEEAPLADDPPVGVEALHPDVVEVRRAVDGRARIRLREVEEVRLERERAHPRWQLVEATRALLPLGLTQDPEPRARRRGEPQLAVLADEFVLAVAEEREVVILEPLEEGLCLGQLLPV